MCGIAGIWIQKPRAASHEVTKMIAALEHRGPDHGGVWRDQDQGIELGHRRLAILELSPMGQQPMASQNERFILVFNGEIYNFKQLRSELQTLGHLFRGNSDTEVVLAAFSQWGIEAALPRFNGMFAMGIWDRQERHLTLARDRFGEKPLYYGWDAGEFVFASELKALRARDRFSCPISKDAVQLYFQYGYIPEPHSIYTGISKLPPGHFVRIVDPLNEKTESEAYWRFVDVAVEKLATRKPISDQIAVQRLKETLEESVRIRLESDVPLGAFLSGGLDSTAVVAAAQKSASNRLKTFTIGFEHEQFNEAPFARQVASHLNTDHTEVIISDKDARAIIPELGTIYDEPFSDSSQIPTLLISRVARQSVTVALSGDGGDELLAGYDNYQRGASWSHIHRLPQFSRDFAATMLRSLPPTAWDKILRQVSPMLPQAFRFPSYSEKIEDASRRISGSRRDLFMRLISCFENTSEFLNLEQSRTKPWGLKEIPEEHFSGVEELMAIDSVLYLPGDILTKVDRASMATSLEVRVPFLDPQMVELAWSLPLELKQRDGKGKWVLRELLRQYIPEKLIDRPKKGFSIPIHEWLRGDLRDWAENLLDSARMAREGYLKPEVVRARWEQHLDGKKNWGRFLWEVLMFHTWLDSTQNGAA